MNIFQSSVEKLMYGLVVLLFIGTIILLFLEIKTTQALHQQQLDFHNFSVANLNLIVRNQVTEEQALKDYIQCLVTINPQGNVQAQVQQCFTNVPQVNK